MGLGKTILSLALISCNKPSDASRYSTKHALKVGHQKTVRIQREDWSACQAQMRPGYAGVRLQIRDLTAEERIALGAQGFELQPNHVPVDLQYSYFKTAATLIIAPPSLVGQWEKEADDKSGGKLRHKRYYGQRSRDVRKYVDQDIIFTTYGILGKEDGSDRKKHVLHLLDWHRVILDESHSIKSSSTNTTRSVLSLQARNKWCLTGTPFG